MKVTIGNFSMDIDDDHIKNYKNRDEFVDAMIKIHQCPDKNKLKNSLEKIWNEIFPARVDN